MKDDFYGIEKWVCPESKCKKPLGESFIKSCTNAEFASNLLQKQQRKRQGVGDCPNCKAHLVNPNGSEGRLFTCMSCSTYWCRLCLNPPHEGRCRSRQELMVKMKLKDPKSPLLPCPHCLQLVFVEPKCILATCWHCHNDFLSCCSAKMTPFTSHGPHYHRPACKKYKASSHPDTMKHDCENCRIANALCEPPSNLLEGDIPPSEVSLS